MGFADAYLLKAGLREKLFETEPHPDLHIIVTIPVYNESGLERCLDSLFQCRVSDRLHAEVLILINAPSSAPGAILQQNRDCYEATLAWISDHPHPSIDFHVLLDHSFLAREAGVGLARKILMDEAARRFSMLGAGAGVGFGAGFGAGAQDGIITGMDADAVVDANYLLAINDHFAKRQTDGCSIYFEHPLADSADSKLTGATFAPEVYDAITQYELHLRYYLQSLRYTAYPYAFHTVGSSFAVRADVYCKEGGMNRRQAGEDFYFIQKIAQRGNFSECNETRVVPSPRPSDRVPFGTGAAVSKLVKGAEPLSTYNPQPFLMLRQLFSGLEILHSRVGLDHFMKSQSELLLEFLEEQYFAAALEEIGKNSASFPAFQKRFWRWFSMFRIMKFLHFARERGYADIPVGDAALGLLKQCEPVGVEIPSAGSALRKLLIIYRKL